jgi:hypothetical protein
VQGQNQGKTSAKVLLGDRIMARTCNLSCLRMLALCATSLFLTLNVVAQESFGERFKELFHNMTYSGVVQTTFSNGDHSPLWLNANKQGLSSVKPNNGYFLRSAGRPLDVDSARKWGIGYDVEMAGAYNFTSSFIIQQMFAEIRFKRVVLAIGSKERPMELKNNELSSGSQTFGINARPVPQVRLEVPRYWNIPGTKRWAAIKGHVGYGIYTDNKWQKDFVADGQRYTKNTLLHTKAGYLRFGREDKFPLVVEGGLEMATQFGGTAYNVADAKGPVKGGTSLKDFWNALIPGGNDATDADYANVEGNWVGSWLASVSWKFPTWRIRGYWDHFFEDHSALFFVDRNGYQVGDAANAQSDKGKFTGYKLKDGLWGLEITLPENPFASSFVYEYLYTKYQSGPIYHDHTSSVPDHLGGLDNYYNHTIYTGWQHWGQAIGNPLYRSPLYNADKHIFFEDTRFIAHHFGVSGDPCPKVHYRVLLTYQEGWGTYNVPFDDKEYNTSFMGEVTYSPTHIGKCKLKGWSITGAFGLDHGKLLGNNTGCQITIRKCGIFNL